MPDGGPAVRRIALGIEYDGSSYHGWQSQTNPPMPTVQAALEAALSRVADHPVRVHCAGRTDSGVHALGQVVHFDSTAQRSLHGWQRGCNTYLPSDICVRWCRSVPSDFHARHLAYTRRYRYIIDNRPVKSAIFAGRVTHFCSPLDAELMHREAQVLVGSHDFTSYRAVACQSRSVLRDVYEISLQRQNHLVVMDIEANAFLMHMIRNIIGVLIDVGCGKRPPGWTRSVLDARDRRAGGVTAPPDGLYFVGALYPESFELPRWAQAPEFAVF